MRRVQLLDRVLFVVANEVMAAAKGRSPYRTGNLRRDISVRRHGDGFAVGNSRLAEYALFVHQGTGVYGPKREPIRPVNAKALKIPGVGFRKSAKGMKARPYLEWAVQDVARSGKVDRVVGDHLVAGGAEIAEALKGEMRGVKVEIG